MKTNLLLAGLLLASPLLDAHESRAPSAPHGVSTVDPALAPIIAIADRFTASLKDADFDAVRTLLDPNVLILESGGAERTREEYLGHHAIADAAFLGGARIKVMQRHGATQGDIAWVATESEIATGSGADAKTLLSTETMVLTRKAGAWTIVHIHWSSRPKKAGAR